MGGEAPNLCSCREQRSEKPLLTCPSALGFVRGSAGRRKAERLPRQDSVRAYLSLKFIAYNYSSEHKGRAEWTQGPDHESPVCHATGSGLDAALRNAKE